MIINIIEYFETTKEKVPDKIAVVEGDKSITFKDLENKAKTLALELINFNIRINKPIAVFLPKCIDSVVADIAISYSSNVYMNLDIKSPFKRIENILNLIQPAAIITSRKLAESLKNMPSNISIIIIDDIDYSLSIDENILQQRREKLIDTDPLCIINTSGSTGTPKGVILNHKSFIDFTVQAIDTLKINDDEIIGSLSPIVFDIFSFELCMLMSKGSTIILIPDYLSAFPVKILKIMQDSKVNFIFWVPTIMVNIANMDLLNTIKLIDLKTVWFAGEVFPTKQFNYWQRNIPNAKFVNLYGPIEITLDCVYYVIDRKLRDDEPIPMGYPFRNTDILILKDNNELAEKGEEGELCVRGSSLSMGYYNNPGKTEEAFVQNPLNKNYPEIIYRTGDIVYVNERSEIMFKGRKDNLIKHLGYRIELGEIEHVIVNSLKLVDNACVLYNKNKKEITVIYEAKKEIPATEFRKSLSLVFPKYMIPAVYQHINILPRNVNGKIDRLQLSQILNG